MNRGHTHHFNPDPFNPEPLSWQQLQVTFEDLVQFNYSVEDAMHSVKDGSLLCLH